MYYNKIAVTTTSPGFYEKCADLGSMQPRESSEIGQQVWIGTQSFSESFKHCKIVLMKVLKMMKRMKKKTLNLNPNSFFGWMFVELALQSCACSLCATLHLTKEADIASAWNLPVESAADPTAMKLQQKRPLQLTDVCVCVKQIQFTFSMWMLVTHVTWCQFCLWGKEAMEDLQGKIVVLDDDDSGADVQVRWTSHHNNKL